MAHGVQLIAFIYHFKIAENQLEILKNIEVVQFDSRGINDIRDMFERMNAYFLLLYKLNIVN